MPAICLYGFAACVSPYRTSNATRLGEANVCDRAAGSRHPDDVGVRVARRGDVGGLLRGHDVGHPVFSVLAVLSVLAGVPFRPLWSLWSLWPGWALDIPHEQTLAALAAVVRADDADLALVIVVMAGR